LIACQNVTGGRAYGNFRNSSGPVSARRRFNLRHAREPPRRIVCVVDALDARSNFEPIMQRDLNKPDDA